MFEVVLKVLCKKITLRQIRHCPNQQEAFTTVVSLPLPLVGSDTDLPLSPQLKTSDK